MPTNNCNKCKGSGVVEKYNHVADGICFKCHGSGSNNKVEIQAAKNYQINLTQAAFGVLKIKPKTKAEIIEDIKISIARYYMDIIYPKTSIGKLKNIREQRKQDARKYYNELLELGYKMTRQEMEQIGRKLRNQEK